MLRKRKEHAMGVDHVGTQHGLKRKLLLFAVCTLSLASCQRADVRPYLPEGRGINDLDQNGQSALMVAARKSADSSVIKALLKKGSDINQTDPSGKTALELAVLGGASPAVISTLASSGANIELVDRESRSTLLIRAIRAKASLDSIRALVEAGADVEAMDGTGATPLMVAGVHWKHAEIIQLLTSAGADAKRIKGPGNSFMLKEGDTALDGAAVRNHSDEIIMALLAAGGVSDKPSTRVSLWQRAIRGHNLAMLEALKKAGFDVNEKDASGSTPLLFAVSYTTQWDTIDALVKAGANVNAKDAKGRTALDYVSGRPEAEGIRQILIKNGAKENK